MTRKKKIISVPRGTAARLAQDVNVSEICVYNALAYRTDSATAKVIRDRALKLYGGIETYKVV